MLGKVLFACILGVALATPQEVTLGERSAIALRRTAANFDSLNEGERLGSVNDMADIMIAEVRGMMGDLGFDPLKLPDVHKNFSFKPIIITYHGELDMARGWAQDISEIYRNGDVKMDYTDRILTVDVPIKFNKILFNYDYNVKLMDLGPDGGVEGSAVDIEIFYSLTLDFNKLVVTLNEFEIVKIGKISVKFTGNGLIDWLVNLLSPIVTGIFKGLIKLIAELVVRNTLNQVIALLNELLQNIAPPAYDVVSIGFQMQQHVLNV